MKSLFISNDKIGDWTGGGSVTGQELLALKEISDVSIFRPEDSYARDNPFYQDRNVLSQIESHWKITPKDDLPTLAHIYSGCMSETVDFLRENNVKVTYTVAAHDLEESKREHKNLGLGFNYPHLTDEKQWQKYTAGYRMADMVIVPSTCAKASMRSLRCRNITIIPHGCPEEIPEIVPLPNRFTVGYLGAIGPDKGLVYLLQAWKELRYKDATLVIAGSQSTTPWMYHLIEKYGGGSVRLLGWVDKVKDFYDSISLYVQPSVTEGFGLEVLEAFQHGRSVLCSLGAGAHDVVPDLWKFFPRDVKELSKKIDASRLVIEGKDTSWCKIWQDKSIPFTWDKIRKQYQKVWEDLLK